MTARSIISPVPRGSGSFVMHRMLERHIPNYRVRAYSPWLEYAPVLLPCRVPVADADLIHAPPDHALFFHRKGIPLVVTVHHYMCDGKMDPYSSYLQKIHYRTDLKWFIRKGISLADELTAVSHYTASHIKKELNVKRNIRVIYNGVDTNLFRPSPVSRDRSRVRVLFSGNLTRRKGAHWLPAISRRLGRGILVACTGGLRSAHTALDGTNITSLGRVDYAEMPELYALHDILLSPTVREGFGLAIAEAMSCGLPVVASDCSAVPELIDHGKGGFLCPVGDVDAFAEKINLLADSPRLRAEMGAYNRAKVERLFTVERMVKEYIELFDTVMAKST